MHGAIPAPRRLREGAMPDKTPHQNQAKKPVKTIKQKRAEKKSKNVAETHADPVAHIKKR
jgi:hypothetical protein